MISAIAAGLKPADAVSRYQKSEIPAQLEQKVIEQKWADPVEMSDSASAIDAALSYQTPLNETPVHDFASIVRRDMARMQELAKTASDPNLSAKDRAKIQNEFNTVRSHLHLALNNLGDRDDYMAEYQNYSDLQAAVLQNGFYQADLSNAESATKAMAQLDQTQNALLGACDGICDREYARNLAHDIMPVINHMRDMAKSVANTPMDAGTRQAVDAEFNTMRSVLHIMKENWGNRSMNYDRFTQITSIFSDSGFYDMRVGSRDNAAQSADVLASMADRLHQLFTAG